MAVIDSNTFYGGFTPICNDCGITLCWDIGSDEYEEQKAFWDTWRCQYCNPNAVGSRKRYLNEYNLKIDKGEK